MTTSRKIVENVVLKIVLILYWMMFLIGTDSYYLVYLLLGGLAIIWMVKKSVANDNRRITEGVVNVVQEDRKSVTALFGAFFSLMVLLANYQLILDYYSATGKYFWIIYTVISALALFGGGVCVYRSLVEFMLAVALGRLWPNRVFSKLPVRADADTDNHQNQMSKRCLKFWLSTFICSSFFYLAILFVFNYPGIISPDAVHQLRMIRDNEYSTHHPLIHTALIKVFYGMGVALFGTSNAGVMCYSIFQILCVAAIIAYVGVTAYEMGIGGKRAAGLVAVYAILPYNIEFSVSMRKDTLFGCLILIAIVSFYRIFRSYSAKIVSWILFVVGIFGICTFRKNGLYVMIACVIMAIIYCAVVWKSGRAILDNSRIKQVLIVSIVATLIGGVTLPLLKVGFNAKDPDALEKLAIPIQQVARVLVDDCEIDEADRALLTGVADLDGIKNAYQDNFVDPIKDYIRLNGNPEFISEHRPELKSLYFKWIKKYPGEFVKAWIDQTRGYYNGGYKYWRWEQGISKNDLDISRSYPSEVVFRIINEYLWLWQNVPLLLPFLCIGLMTWLMMLALNIGIIKRKAVIAFMTLPALLNIGTLLLATPVFAEFRYAYASFLCVPFVALAMIKELSKSE